MLNIEITHVPDKCGCYIFKNSSDKPIYIGKAKNLKSRIKSYLSNNSHFKINRLLNEATQIEFILTNNEWEAFLLENNLIKQFKPKFNVLLKDDKTYPFIKINLKKDYPKAEFTRKMLKDGAKYYGPFVPASNARNILKIIQEYFGVATCKDPLDGKRVRPCILFEMGKCLAPCVRDKITKENYRKRVEEAILFLEGKNEELIKILEERMLEASKKQEYELAANYRDLLKAAKDLKESQNVVFQSKGHIDFFSLLESNGYVIVQNFKVLDGKIVDKREFLFEDVELKSDEFLETILTQLYTSSLLIPDEIALSSLVKNRSFLERFLSEKKGKKVKITYPQKGRKKELLKLLTKNCYESLKRLKDKSNIFNPLSEYLKTNNRIKRIEAFDVSHFSGEGTYISLVVWENGNFNKKEYRKFTIKEAKVRDDYGAIYEAVLRRYRRLIAEGKILPDLVLIDGGPYQAKSAKEALLSLNLNNIIILGLAKKEEKLFLPKDENPLPFTKEAPFMLILRQIRDEAHRFAITSSRKKVVKNRFNSPLLEIKGIGKKSLTKLIKKFLTTENILSASFDDLAKVVGKDKAKRIISFKENQKKDGRGDWI